MSKDETAFNILWHAYEMLDHVIGISEFAHHDQKRSDAIKAADILASEANRIYWQGNEDATSKE